MDRLKSLHLFTTYSKPSCATSCFPIESKRLQKRIIADLNLYLADNTQAWILSADGRYQRAARNEGDEMISAQNTLLEELAKVN